MGKGDIKSRKGKMANGSFGNTRRRNETMPKVVKTKVSDVAVAEQAVEAKPKAKAKTKKAED